jgi:hypothetical protein
MTEITRLRARAQLLSRLAKAAPGALAGRLSSRAAECLTLAAERERELAVRPQDGHRPGPPKGRRQSAQQQQQQQQIQPRKAD